jgi:hypothetical protein
MWDEVWDEVIPALTEGEPYHLMHLGDIIDGDHHDVVTTWSRNLVYQKRGAIDLLKPKVKMVKEMGGEFYQIRGTEAHSGKAGAQEEDIAQELGAKPNEGGQYARYLLRIRIGQNPENGLIHAMHHISVSGSTIYQATPLRKELAEEYVQAARWGREIPDCRISGHVHQFDSVEFVTYKGNGISVTCPGWQGRTGFTARGGAKMSVPQFGVVVLRWHPIDGIYVREKVWTPEPEGIEEG